MKHVLFYKYALGVVCIMFFLSVLAPAQPLFQVGLIKQSHCFQQISQGSQPLVLLESGNIQKSTLYADGSIISLPTESIYRLILGPDSLPITAKGFEKLIVSGLQQFQADPVKFQTQSEPLDPDMDVVFTVSSPPVGAMAAIEEVETYLESIFDDIMTVTITLGFDSMGGNVLGWTSSEYAGPVSWTATRYGLQNNMDADDSIQEWLPSGSTIPVRYIYGSDTVTNENKCYFTKANYKATVGTVTGIAAHMEFNLDYSWDYDPSDGIPWNKYCFQSVLVHEVGHALGFTSAADFRTNDIEALDIFRFQNTDGDFDYNPDTLEEFQTTSRLVDADETGSGSDDVVSDLIDDQYRMSDGNPYQCSHFKQGVVWGIMQPAIGPDETFYPNFFRPSDIAMLDAIGYDYYEIPYYYLTTEVEGSGAIIINPDQSSYLDGTIVHLTAEPTEDYWCFSHWSGDIESTNPDIYVTMDDDKSVTAHFIDACPWDVNDDGLVSPQDVGFIKFFYGQDPSFAAYAIFDVNDDGSIDPQDVGLVKFYYGDCPSCES